jgi:hypothetical protein
MFHKEFQKFVHEENLKPDQIYNTDVSGLYWKGLPTRTIIFEREKCTPGHKSSTEGLTVTSCGNASGNHKLKPKQKKKKKKKKNCSRLQWQTAFLSIIKTR